MMTRSIVSCVVLALGLQTTLLAAEPSPAPATVFNSIEAAIATARTSDFGQGKEAMEYVRDRIMEHQLEPTARNEIANALATSLGHESSTYAWKLFVCRQLYVIGGEAQVDALTPLLRQPELTDVARYALEVIPGDTVNDVLWEAIPYVDASIATGLVASLSARGGASTVMRLAELLHSPHPELISAALAGLGHIGGQEAEHALSAVYASLSDTLRTQCGEAMLACAEHYRVADRTMDAERLYQELQQATHPLPVRLAAFLGLVRLDSDGAAPAVAQALLSGEKPWISAALTCVRMTGGPNVTLLYAGQLGLVGTDTQVLLIGALADRGDPSALPAVVAGIGSADSSVQLAALDALGILGNETTVPLLLGGLTSSDTTISEHSRQSLTRLSDAGVNGALIRVYDQADPNARAALAPILAERNIKEALPSLYNVAAHQDGETRRSAFKAIGKIADEENLDDVVNLFYDADTEETRGEAADAITDLCRHVAPSDARSTARAAIYTLAPTSLTRAGALDIFRNLGDDVLLPLVISACDDQDSIVREAGVAALCGWPSTAPLKEVQALLNKLESETLRALALDGYIRMLRLPSDQTDNDKLAGFKSAMDLAGEKPEVLRAIMAGVSDLRSMEAVEFLESFLNHPLLHAEAAIGAEKILRHFYRTRASLNEATTKNALDGNIDSFWGTGVPQESGQWFEINLSRPARIRGIVLDSSRTRDAWPRSYSVQVFPQGAEPGEAIVSGTGVEGATEITFPRVVTGQIVRITLTADAPESPWVIHELQVLPDLDAATPDIETASSSNVAPIP